MKLLGCIILLVISMSLSGEILFPLVVEVPEMAVDTLVAYAKFESAEINESSALQKSRIFDGVYWTLNDSGDEARIFPFTSDGKSLKPQWEDKYKGIAIPNAVNIDWEDISTDNHGNLIIAACGNNANVRKDLGVYIVPEPHPLGINKTRAYNFLAFNFPDQDAFPPEKSNFDCEAIFTANDNLYFLSKHRSDSNTKLYRYNNYHLEAKGMQSLELLNMLDIKGMVTAADCTVDGKKLAVLTYTAVWVFVVETGDDFFNGSIYYKAISAKQCEGICWDSDEDMLVSNEQMDLFKLNISDLTKIK